MKAVGGTVFKRHISALDPPRWYIISPLFTIVLTPTEFNLLYLLGKNRHMTLSHEFIWSALWADDVLAKDTLKKYVQRLRRKLGDDAKNPNWIRTVHGLGYRLTSSAREATPSGGG